MQNALGLEKVKARCLTEQNANLLKLVDQERSLVKETTTNLRLELDSKTQIVSDLKSNITNLSEDLQNTFATIDKLQAEKDDAEETISNLRNTMDTSNMLREKTSELENQISKRRKSIELLRTEKSHFEVNSLLNKYFRLPFCLSVRPSITFQNISNSCRNKNCFFKE